jgi:hypothetical protein
MTQEGFGASLRASVVVAVAALGVFHTAPVWAQFSYSGINLSAQTSSSVNGVVDLRQSTPITTLGVFSDSLRTSTAMPATVSAYIESDVGPAGFVLTAGAGAGYSNGNTSESFSQQRANWNNPNYVAVPISQVVSGGAGKSGGTLTFTLREDTLVTLSMKAAGGFSFNSSGDTSLPYSGKADVMLSGGDVFESLSWRVAPTSLVKDILLKAGTYTVQLNASGGVSPISTTGHFNMSDVAQMSVRAAVPEPASWALMALGFTGLAAVARRRPVSQG